MRFSTAALAAAALTLLGTASRADGPGDLKVLYAGNPGSDREQDFVSLLREHFAEVGTVSYERFEEDDADDYDVVIFDWTSIYPRDEDGKIKEEFTGLNSPTPPELSEDYDRPTILIGAAGGYVARPLRLKLDWR